MSNLHGASERMYSIKDIFEVSSYIVVKVTTLLARELTNELNSSQHLLQRSFSKEQNHPDKIYNRHNSRIILVFRIML